MSSTAQALVDAAQGRITDAFDAAETQLDDAVTLVAGSAPAAIPLQDITLTTTILSALDLVDNAVLDAVPDAPAFSQVTDLDLTNSQPAFAPLTQFQNRTNERISGLWGYVMGQTTNLGQEFDPDYDAALATLEAQIAVGLNDAADTPTGTGAMDTRLSARVEATRVAAVGQNVTAMTKRGFPLPSVVQGVLTAQANRESLGRNGQAIASSQNQRKRQNIQHLQACIKESLELQSNVQKSLATYANLYLDDMFQAISFGQTSMEAMIADITGRIDAVEAEVAAFSAKTNSWGMRVAFMIDPQLAVIEQNLEAVRNEYMLQVNAREATMRKLLGQAEGWTDADVASATNWNRWSRNVANTAVDSAKVWGNIATSAVGAMNTLTTLEGSA